MKHSLLPALALLLLAQCQKADPDPASQLPPATQTGANTFGCLLNGQAYTPKGNDGTRNLYSVYDPTIKGGDLTIGTYRIEEKLNQGFVIEGTGLRATTIGTHSFAYPNGTCVTRYNSIPTPYTSCSSISSEQEVAYRSGTLTLTRFDLQARIASGTFAFKVLPVGCADTLRVTQGRFDVTF